MSNFEFTDDLKKEALRLFEEETTNINYIVKKITGDESLDARHTEGREIKKFLIRSGKEYHANGSAMKQLDLTEEQKKLLMSDRVTAEMNALEATRLAYQDPSIKPLTQEHRSVINFLKIYRSDVIDENDIPTDGKWREPKSIETVVKKINKWCVEDLDVTMKNMHTSIKKNVQKLYNNLRTFAFLNNINAFKLQGDRDLFESEFIRLTWDKPDLTAEEVNLYLIMCGIYVRRHHVEKKLAAFNASLEEEDIVADNISNNQLNYYKQLNSELEEAEKKINDITHKVNGSRADRIKKAQENSGNFLSIVEEFQKKESRDHLVRVAEVKNKLAEKELDRLESVNEIKVRLFGFSKDEIV